MLLSSETLQLINDVLKLHITKLLDCDRSTSESSEKPHHPHPESREKLDHPHPESSEKLLLPPGEECYEKVVLCDYSQTTSEVSQVLQACVSVIKQMKDTKVSLWTDGFSNYTVSIFIQIIQ